MLNNFLMVQNMISGLVCVCLYKSVVFWIQGHKNAETMRACIFTLCNNFASTFVWYEQFLIEKI